MMATKGKGKREQTKSPPPPLEAEQPTEREIVAGKITESEWLSLLSQEDAIDTVSYLVEETFDVAFSIINAQYLEKQAFPYTVQDAKQSLLKIIEWQFLAHDDGEKDTERDPSWTEDEEPQPATIDSWARGVVPLASETRLHSAMIAADPVTPLSREAVDYGGGGNDSRAMTDTASTTPRSSRMSSTTRTSPLRSSLTNQKQASTTTTTTTLRSRRPVARRPQARLVALEKAPIEDRDGEDPGNQLERHPSSLHSHTPDSFTTLTPSHIHKRPLPFNMKPAQLAFQKDVTYDERGNIVDMVRLDPRKFPSHLVKPIVTIVKPPPPTDCRSKTKQRYGNNHTHHSGGKSINRRSLNDDPRGASRKPPKNSKGGVVQAVHGTSDQVDQGYTVAAGGGGVSDGRESRRFPEVPALPSLIDTIDPVPGVTIREGGKTLHGPRRYPTSLQPPSSPPRNKLRPIRPVVVTNKTERDSHSKNHHHMQQTHLVTT